MHDFKIDWKHIKGGLLCPVYYLYRPVLIFLSLCCIGWVDDMRFYLRFYILVNGISVISGRCSDDNERLCAEGLRLRLRRFHFE